MSNRLIDVGIVACIGLGAADLAFLNLHLFPQILTGHEEAGGSGQAAPAQSLPLPIAKSRVADPDGRAGNRADVNRPQGAAPIDSAATDRRSLAAPGEPASAGRLQHPPASTAGVKRRGAGDGARGRGRVIWFARNRASLGESTRDALDETAALLLGHEDMKVVIAGHADRTGSDEVNERMSRRRAERVMSYLLRRGVAHDQIEVRSFGDREPLDEGDSEAALQRNRRVELYLLQGGR